MNSGSTLYRYLLGGGGAAMRRRYPTTGRSTCWKPAERGCIRRIHWESKGSAIAG